MQFRVSLDHLPDELREQYAETIRRETERYIKELRERYSDLRCEKHGEALTIQVSFHQNMYTGVIALHRIAGCCSEFEASVYDHLSHLQSLGDWDDISRRNLQEDRQNGMPPDS